MARKTKTEQEAEKVQFVMEQCSKCYSETTAIRNTWEQNFQQFDIGSLFDGKDEWQSQIALKKMETRLRAGAGQARDILVNSYNWFDLDPINPQDQELNQYVVPLKKLMRYHLDRAKFPRKVSTLLLLAFLSLATTSVGWTKRKLKNPAFVEWKFKEGLRKNKPYFEDSANNPIADRFALDEEGIANSLKQGVRALNDLVAAEDDDPLDFGDPEPERYISIGGIDIKIPNPQSSYWDSTVNYLEDSPWRAFDEYPHEWQVYHLAELGFFDKKKMKDIPGFLPEPTLRIRDVRQKKARVVMEDRMKLTWYFGPLVLKDSQDRPKVVKADWGCIIANESVIIKEWDFYPYIEPSNHMEHPFVDASVKEVPFRPTGAGIGDNAVKLDRQADSNLNLMNDQMRLNTIGFGIANHHALIDKDVIDNGIAPGQILRSRVSPKDTYQHISLTSNVERQWDPVNQTINDSIDEQMGVSKISLGGPTKKSRTTAKEIDAVMGATDKAISNIAIDLEQTFLVPFLEKVFYRILQFGLDEIRSNPELQNVLTQSEIEALGRVSKGDRLGKFAFAFKFNIKGFSSNIAAEAKVNKLLELISVVSQSGALTQMVDLRPVLEALLQEMDLEELLSRAILPMGEADKIIVENQLLGMGSYVQPMPEDNHDAHIESHLQVPNPSDAMKQHVMEHQQLQQMILEQQQQQGQGQPPLTQ